MVGRRGRREEAEGERREGGRGEKRRKRGEAISLAPLLKEGGGGKRQSGTGPGEDHHPARVTRKEAGDQGPRCPVQKQRRVRAAGRL